MNGTIQWIRGNHILSTKILLSNSLRKLFIFGRKRYLAETETMPFDFSVLLARATPTRLGYDRMVTDWTHVSPLACRRVSSFPIVNGPHQKTTWPLPSGLKVRSQSESEVLHRQTPVASLADVKRELGRQEPIEEHPLHGQCKRVTFADECGGDLCTVRLMTEPSDVPPQLSPTVLRALSEDCGGRVGAGWVVAFTQPASHYIKFRDSLERNKVALENVLVKNDKCKMVGTVKVKNVTFEKQVFIRFTDNNWQSYFDRPSCYQRSTTATAHIYDTFCFDIDIPPDDDRHNRIEFCVCYRANGQEFWDSNEGNNYSLLSPELYERLKNNEHKHKHGQLFGTSPTAQHDAYSMDYRHWSTFASWKNLSNETPYW